MASDRDRDYALLAGNVYRSTRTQINQIPVPVAQGWQEIDGSYRNLPSGFEAAAFKNITTGEIVIAFAGTGPGSINQPDWIANVDLFLGAPSSQLREAALYYEVLKAQQLAAGNVNPQITFTGHSLGGGLAALMGVFFDRPAIPFDGAPFLRAANTAVRDDLIVYLTRFADAALAGFTNLNFASRLKNVNGRYVVGEVNNVDPSLRIGTNIPIHHEPASVFLATDLHSISLLTAFLYDGTFRLETYDLPNLIPLMFDDRLFKFPVSSSTANFIDLLVRNQVTVQDSSGTGLLNHFAIDMARLGKAWRGDKNGNELLNKALIAFGIQAYFEQDGGIGKEIFDTFTGGIRFDRSAVTQTLLGYDLFFKSYLASIPDIEAQIAAFGKSLSFADWYLATGKGAAVAQAKTAGAFMLGGVNIDSFTGSTKADLIIGGDNGDVLAGGKGDDLLYGGDGGDTYIWKTGDGNDTIIDSDKRGTILINDATHEFKASNFTKVSTDVYKSSDGKITLTHHSPWMLVTESGEQIVLGADFVDGNFGIHLREALIDPVVVNAAVVNGTGDADLLNGSNVSDQLLGGDGDDGMRGEAGNDILDGGAGNDFGRGDDGDDSILGGAGDDLFGGNAGKDLLQGGAGSDTLYGGDGDDQVYADDKVKLADAIASTATPTGIKGGFLSGGAGDDWIVGNADNEFLEGGGGADIMVGGTGDDFILGDADLELWDTGTWEVSTDAAGNKTLLNISRYAGTLVPADGGNDEIYAGSGNDWVRGQTGDDTLYGEGGSAPAAYQGNDLLDRGHGNDILARFVDDDILLGGAGDDTEVGGTSNDSLDGGSGDDQMTGEEGDDTLDGGNGPFGVSVGFWRRSNRCWILTERR
jgi:Ca2+-binding RTX toxin-like protein